MLAPVDSQRTRNLDTRPPDFQGLGLGGSRARHRSGVSSRGKGSAPRISRPRARTVSTNLSSQPNWSAAAISALMSGMDSWRPTPSAATPSSAHSAVSASTGMAATRAESASIDSIIGICRPQFAAASVRLAARAQALLELLSDYGEPEPLGRPSAGPVADVVALMLEEE